MDKSFEEIRTEVLELDRESQRRLADELEEKLSESDWDVEWRTEIKRRLDQHRNGEGTYLTTQESLAKGRASIEEAKRKQK